MDFVMRRARALSEDGKRCIVPQYTDAALQVSGTSNEFSACDACTFNPTLQPGTSVFYMQNVPAHVARLTFCMAVTLSPQRGFTRKRVRLTEAAVPGGDVMGTVDPSAPQVVVVEYKFVTCDEYHARYLELAKEAAKNQSLRKHNQQLGFKHKIESIMHTALRPVRTSSRISSTSPGSVKHSQTNRPVRPRGPTNHSELELHAFSSPSVENDDRFHTPRRRRLSDLGQDHTVRAVIPPELMMLVHNIGTSSGVLPMIVWLYVKTTLMVSVVIKTFPRCRRLGWDRRRRWRFRARGQAEVSM